MPERLSSASGFKAPMIAVRQLHMLSCDTAQHLCPAAVGHRLRCLDHVTRHRDHQVGALDSGQRLAAAADQVDLHTEQLNGCAPVLLRPHQVRALPLQRGQDTAGSPASACASISRTALERLRATETRPFVWRDTYRLRRACKRPNRSGA